MKPEKSFTKIIQYLDKTIFNNKKFDIKNTLVITGSPRSGTTWLMEILRVIPGYTSLFEPLNPIYFPESFETGFRSRTYLSPNKDWQIGEEYLKKIFTGQYPYYTGLLESGSYLNMKFSMLISGLLYQLKPELLIHKLLGNKLIVKFVRFNRLLPWVVKRFQLRNIILIIRHPCAVIASQLKTGFYGYHPAFPPYIDIFPNRKNILDEASKIDVLNHSLLNKLKKIKTKEEILAASWCLDTYVPLSYPKPYPWTVVIYEKLIKDGENEIIRLFNEIGEKKVPHSAFRHIRIPSLLIQKDDHEIILEASEQLSKWKRFLSEKQVERILRVVSDFGLDFYTEDLEPDYENVGI